jgi:hypothetical protein
VDVTGEFEVDEAGVGRAGGVEHDVVGFRVLVAQGEEGAGNSQLIHNRVKFTCSPAVEGHPESRGVLGPEAFQLAETVLQRAQLLRTEDAARCGA